MIVVEGHYIGRQHQFFQQFDDLSLLSKKLYNHANYWMRQHFLKSGSSVGVGLNLKQLYAIVKATSDYKSLPAKVSNQVLKQVIQHLHQASNLIVKRLVDEQIGELVIGKNEKWKRNVELGKKTNQTFCSIPHAKLIEMIAYKSELVNMIRKVSGNSLFSECSNRLEVFAVSRVRVSPVRKKPQKFR